MCFLSRMLIENLQVGYGDMYAKSVLGRTTAILATVSGTSLVALLVAAVHDAIQYTNNEELTEYALNRSRLSFRLRHKAARVIQCLFRVGISRHKVTLALRARCGRTTAGNASSWKKSHGFKPFGIVKGVWLGTPCSSWSRARKGVPGSPGGPARHWAAETRP